MFIKRMLQTELPAEIRKKIVHELFDKYVGVEESVFSKELYDFLKYLSGLARTTSDLINRII